jgi:predicted XRE-type DNA-binding protein
MRRKMKRRIDHEPSSGNIFADIGLRNPEVVLAKAEIARQVNRTIGEKGLTQSEAAAILGIDQPRVSALAKGRLSLFSLEKLMGFSSKLGSQVEIRIGLPARRNPARLRVVDLSTIGKHQPASNR